MKHMDAFRLKRRAYLHFDAPAPEREALRVASDAQEVAQRSFLPFIRYEKKMKRVKRGPMGALVRNDKKRPICYASHMDAAIYQYYGNELSGAYERFMRANGIGDCVTAFRPGLGKSTIHYAADVFCFISKQSACTCLAFDVESFFDNLDHATLKNAWESVMGVTRLTDDHFAVYKSVTRYAFVERKELYQEFGISQHNPWANGRSRICSPQEFRDRVRGKGLIHRNEVPQGIPQGSPISAVLSNVYMIDFDKRMNEFATQSAGIYRRYCDDILLVLPGQDPQIGGSVVSMVEESLSDLKLKLQPSKTSMHYFPAPSANIIANKAPLQYLGFTYDGKRVLLRPAGVARYYSKQRAGVRLAKTTRDRVDKALGMTGPPSPLKTRKLYVLYSHVGRRNYIAYALRAARNMVGVDSGGIRKQVAKHMRKLKWEIDEN